MNFLSIKIPLNFGHLNTTNWTFKGYNCRRQLCVLIRSNPILHNGTLKFVSVDPPPPSVVVCYQSFSCFHSNLLQLAYCVGMPLTIFDDDALLNSPEILKYHDMYKLFEIN